MTLKISSKQLKEMIRNEVIKEMKALLSENGVRTSMVQHLSDEPFHTYLAIDGKRIEPIDAQSEAEALDMASELFPKNADIWLLDAEE